MVFHILVPCQCTGCTQRRRMENEHPMCIVYPHTQSIFSFITHSLGQVLRHMGYTNIIFRVLKYHANEIFANCLTATVCAIHHLLSHSMCDSSQLWKHLIKKALSTTSDLQNDGLTLKCTQKVYVQVLFGRLEEQTIFQESFAIVN